MGFRTVVVWEQPFFTSLRVTIYGRFCWGMNNISKWGEVKKEGLEPIVLTWYLLIGNLLQILSLLTHSTKVCQVCKVFCKWFIFCYHVIMVTVKYLTTQNMSLGIYLLKVNNKNTRTRCEICSKLTIKTPERCQWHHSGVFIINFEHISHLVLKFLFITLNM